MKNKESNWILNEQLNSIVQAVLPVSLLSCHTSHGAASGIVYSPNHENKYGGMW